MERFLHFYLKNVQKQGDSSDLGGQFHTFWNPVK